MLERLFPQQADDKLFVENVFSTTLYSGTGGFRGINVGISNFAVAGGMVWMKARNSGVFGNEIHRLYDTARANSSGGGSLVCSPSLQSNSASQDASGSSVTFYSTGTAITVAGGNPNNSDYNYAAWSFRKAPKFFDVVTYTGDGSVRTIAHNLGVAPGMIFIKSSSETSYWIVYHRSVGATKYLILSLTQAEASYSHYFNNTEPTASVFTLGNDQFDVNKIGTQYVAYLFAHDPSADGIIQCGSFTAGVSTGTASVTLGWEPQWLLIKGSNSTAVGDSGGIWSIMDNMRGMNAASNAVQLQAQSSGAEGTNSQQIRINSTGFTAGNMAGSSQFIYVAIRRGPMRTPTLGTSVFSPVANSSAIDASTPVSLVPPASDLWLSSNLGGAAPYWQTRLMGWAWLRSSSTSAQDTSYTWTQRTQSDLLPSGGWWSAGTPQVNYFFRRAPGFMDVVCYTGTGDQSLVVNHGLGAVPEMVITKKRTGSNKNWGVYTAFVGTANKLRLNTTESVINDSFFFPATPTSTILNQGNADETNEGGSTYVAYLFASVPGVSKVGSYTGNGSSQTINCAFTTGARFVMIKRTNAAGDWYVWDSARGIVAGNDPYLALNTTAAEVTTNDSVDADSTGFVVNQVAASNINVNAATYIFLAIA